VRGADRGGGYFLPFFFYGGSARASSSWLIFVPPPGLVGGSFCFIVCNLFTKIVCVSSDYFEEPGYLPSTRQPPPLEEDEGRRGAGRDVRVASLEERWRWRP
jgi:hypothetical protein